MEYASYTTLKKQKHFQKEFLSSQKNGVRIELQRRDIFGGTKTLNK